MIHLPAWERFGHNVVDICDQQGVNPKAIILAHMDPSIYDWEYQKSLLNRGVNIEYDGIGMGLYYEGEGQCPSDDEISKAVIRVFSSGYGESLLLSQDVFLKIQRRKYGGNGYAHMLRSFLPRLKRMGLSREKALDLLISNPKRVFEEAAQNI
jgi:phosphotriesterase-related protein